MSRAAWAVNEARSMIDLLRLGDREGAIYLLALKFEEAELKGSIASTNEFARVLAAPRTAA